VRGIIVVLVVQTVLMGIVLAKVIGIEERTATAVPSASTAALSGTPTTAQPKSRSPDPAPYLSEEQLRRIVRQELSDQLDRLRRDETTLAGTVDSRHNTSIPGLSPTAAVPRDPTAIEAVSHRIDYFISLGSISHTEMADLQAEIAGLGDEDRKRMLTKLARAMNTGQLKGRF